jgi:integrase
MPRARQTRIYQRPGRAGWYCDLDDGRRRVSLQTTDREEAHRRYGEHLQRGRVLKLAPGSRALAAVFAETRKRAEAANTPKTVYELHLNLKRVLEWLEERGIVSTAQLSKQVVEDYKSARRFSVSAGCVNRETTSWRRAVKVAVELGAIDAAAPSWFVRMREPRPAPHQKGYSKAQLERFIKASPPGYRDLFRLALGTGMRDEELRHMEAGDVRKRWILVTPKEGWTTKGYRHREIPVSPKTVAAAKAFLKVRDSLNLDKKRVWTIAQAASVKAEIEPLSLHELRRAWGSHLLAVGNRIEDVSRWFGHADLLTTMRYLRVTNDRHPGAKKLAF